MVDEFRMARYEPPAQLSTYQNEVTSPGIPMDELKSPDFSKSPGGLVMATPLSQNYVLPVGKRPLGQNSHRQND